MRLLDCKAGKWYRRSKWPKGIAFQARENLRDYREHKWTVRFLTKDGIEEIPLHDNKYVNFFFTISEEHADFHEAYLQLCPVCGDPIYQIYEDTLEGTLMEQESKCNCGYSYGFFYGNYEECIGDECFTWDWTQNSPREEINAAIERKRKETNGRTGI